MTSKELPHNHFNHIFQLPPPLITPALEVSQYAGHFLAEEPKAFRWTEFLSSIQRFPGNNLAMLEFRSESINQHTTTIETAIDDIANLLVSGQGRVIELRNALEKILTDSNKVDPTGSGWQYRVHFAFVAEEEVEAPVVFHSLLATIRLEVEGGEESSWWNLQSGTLANLSVVIDVVELVIPEGFKDPMEVASYAEGTS
ncbi:hypothetical protein V5O48_017999 [Marasmius crinis-equi]|uniref:Uncharacterized protein n=1 Tax=Marasmius crinis-equi TaxID=585013 RepID=A0ABR3EMD8_9AGAR